MSNLGKKDVETLENLEAVREICPKAMNVSDGMRQMFADGMTVEQVIGMIQDAGGTLNKYAMIHWRHREGYVKTKVVVKKKKERKMCTACGRKEVYGTNHFLCRDCQREAPTGEMIYTVGTIARHDSRF